MEGFPATATTAIIASMDDVVYISTKINEGRTLPALTINYNYHKTKNPGFEGQGFEFL
jgi:hypothetical protein